LELTTKKLHGLIEIIYMLKYGLNYTLINTNSIHLLFQKCVTSQKYNQIMKNET
jgi:hypothetical protein